MTPVSNAAPVAIPAPASITATTASARGPLGLKIERTFNAASILVVCGRRVVMQR
jgi:hypothetical protein